MTTQKRSTVCQYVAHVSMVSCERRFGSDSW